ncbi:MAG: hypothetical protein HQL94_11225, partial [Magnetococcales bacterium]|nr:hypothetical protein [Magnetococcales bacterium]
DGSQNWSQVTKAPLRGVDGSIIGVLGVSTDITAIKQTAEEMSLLQERAYQNDRLATLGFVTAGIAHEVNNPNAVIIMNTRLIQDVWEDAKKILDEYYRNNGNFSLGGSPYLEMQEMVAVLLNGIVENARRIQSIIDNLKALTQPHCKPNMQPIDLREIITNAASFLREKIKRHTRHFTTSWDDRPYLVMGSSDQLFQIFTNLIMNALQSLPHIESAVSIHIVTNPTERKLHIEIRDEGCGIAPDHLSRMGTPFFTTRQDQGGMGMGFSITQKMIEWHQGTIVVRSEVGQGTLVTIGLPEWENG